MYRRLPASSCRGRAPISRRWGFESLHLLSDAGPIVAAVARQRPQIAHSVVTVLVANLGRRSLDRRRAGVRRREILGHGSTVVFDAGGIEEGDLDRWLERYIEEVQQLQLVVGRLRFGANDFSGELFGRPLLERRRTESPSRDEALHEGRATLAAGLDGVRDEAHATIRRKGPIGRWGGHVVQVSRDQLALAEPRIEVHQADIALKRKSDVNFVEDTPMGRQPFHGIVVGALIGLVTPHRGPAQRCQLFTAALDAVGATPGTTILVAQTTNGVPQFALSAYTSMLHGDTTLARVMIPLLEKANAARVPVPSCLVDSLGWHTIADSTLFGLFRPDSGDSWANFRRAFSATPTFALLSQAVLAGDTATLYVAIARGHLNGVGKIVQFVRDSTGRWVKRADVQIWIA